MKHCFEAIRVSDHVYWVGAIDWTIRDFHGYTTRRGSTYNAYLILADKVTLIDTVKAPFKDEMLARIASVVAPESIHYIVSNHSEMDHSGCLPDVAATVRPEKVFASVMGAKTLEELFHTGQDIVPLKDGDRIDLGNMTLSFMETRMLHWPDSMFSFLAEENVLFSQDAFGMHLATSERFTDEIDPAITRYEASTYYANIILPYSSLVLKLLNRISASGLKFKVIAPDHGPIWREDLSGIVGLYKEWAEQKPRNKAVVVYGTMWHSTEKMARAIAEGLASRGTTVKLMSMDAFHRSDVVYEILDAGALIAGSPTLNNQMLPQMADVLTYLKGLKPANLIGTSFGSYGWSGESVRHIQDILTEMKVAPAGDPIRTKHVPGEEELGQCFRLGRSISDQLREAAR